MLYRLCNLQHPAEQKQVHVVCDDIAEQEPVPNLQPSSSPERNRTYTTGSSESACRSTTSRTAPKRRSQPHCPGPAQPTTQHTHTTHTTTQTHSTNFNMDSTFHSTTSFIITLQIQFQPTAIWIMMAGSLLFMLTKLQATITIHAFVCFTGLSLSMPSSSS